LSHIALRAIHELLSKGLVTGFELIPSDKPKVCEVCIHAKSTRQPVPCVREGECAATFGDKVHSDLWGPSRVTTLGGQQYYISFTDN
ncbi:hypothetical protein POSPLADRAFT_1118617, partial [Postia placenta MAD-698-R-SB12]